MHYIEIEDIDEISTLNKALKKKLAEKSTRSVKRTIGYPAGHFERHVSFYGTRGDTVLWSASYLEEERETLINLFGHADPNDNKVLFIDLQFNHPANIFRFKYGGVFLRDAKGHVYLAHRGIVTLGNGRVKKSTILEAMSETVVTAETSKGPKDYMLIAELDSPRLLRSIDNFSREIRQIIRNLDNDPDAAGITADRNGRDRTRHTDELKDYFDEFSGKQERAGKGHSVADCFHGDVVRCLRDRLREQPTIERIHKSRAIDLAAMTAQEIYLYEVKTSTTPYSIYTALGQLTLHGHALQSRFRRATIKRIMVLPDVPHSDMIATLTGPLNISLLYFKRSKDGQISIPTLRL